MRAAYVLAALTISAAAHAADITYETRALTGTDGPLGPGLGAGVSFVVLGNPVLNGAGQLAFSSRLTGAGITSANDRGIWSEGSGSGLALVARKGNQAPGTAPGVNFDFFFNPLLNGAGHTAFGGGLTGAGVTSANDRGIWSEGGGSGLALVARTGNQAPGTAAGVNFGGSIAFSDIVLNGAGQTAFGGRLTGSGVVFETNDRGIWSEGGGAGLALVARIGNRAPDTTAGVNFLRIGNPVINGAGQTAFVGNLTGSSVTDTNAAGIWSEGGGSGVALVARRGSQAPGAAPDEDFGSFDLIFASPVINGAGQIAFSGSLDGPENDFNFARGIWSEGGGSGLALVAREGRQAPGTAGANFEGFDSPVINGAGQLAFSAPITGAGVTGSNNWGVWSEGGGSGLALVVRKGDPAPGTAAGVIFSQDFSNPVINGAGQTAFFGDLTGAGVTSANDRGIWATRLDGMVQLIAREGDLFDVSNDPVNPDPRTISALALVTNGGGASGGEDGRRPSFNDAGQLAFFASFTDGSSGLFVATIGDPTVPPFKITITPATPPATGYDLTWNSQSGKVYDLVSSTDLATPIAQWPLHDSYGDLPATGTTTTLTAVPRDGLRRFFAVIEKDAPPAN